MEQKKAQPLNEAEQKQLQQLRNAVGHWQNKVRLDGQSDRSMAAAFVSIVTMEDANFGKLSRRAVKQFNREVETIIRPKISLPKK